MQIFKDLFIDVGSTKIDSVISNITRSIEDSELWRRQIKKEEKFKNFEPAFAFERKADEILPNVGLSIFKKENSIWYVANIVPLETSQISMKEYNDILTEFHNLFVSNIKSNLSYEITLTSDLLSNEEILGAQANQLLKSFSSCANKSTGIAHPLDQRRWFSFIKQVSAEERKISSDYLLEILVEQG